VRVLILNVEFVVVVVVVLNGFGYWKRIWN
jgi:hypothetical protein